jgi:hypothetical protein
MTYHIAHTDYTIEAAGRTEAECRAEIQRLFDGGVIDADYREVLLDSMMLCTRALFDLVEGFGGSGISWTERDGIACTEVEGAAQDLADEHGDGRVYAYCRSEECLVYRIPGHRHGDGSVDSDDEPVWLVAGDGDEDRIAGDLCHLPSAG